MRHSVHFNMNKPEYSEQYDLAHWNENTDIMDSALYDEQVARIRADGLKEDAANKVSSWSDEPNNSRYPSERLVKNTIDDEVTARTLGDSTLQSALNILIPVGTVFPYLGINAPQGYLFCNGATVSRTTYANLFNVIGTKFGSGDGSTTFVLPDLRNRFIEGSNSSSQVGDYLQAGLPSASHRHEAWTSEDGTHYHEYAHVTPEVGEWEIVRGGESETEIYQLVSSVSSSDDNIDTSTEGAHSHNVNFGQSTSFDSPIYGRSDTVQPPAMLANYIIKY